MTTLQRMLLVATLVLVTAGAATSAQTATPSTQTAPREAPASPVAIANGKRLFASNGCGGCHGLEGQGAPTTGPRLAPQPLPLAALIRYVRAPRLQMPPYTEKVISDQDLSDVRAFLASRPAPAGAAVVAP